MTPLTAAIITATLMTIDQIATRRGRKRDEARAVDAIARAHARAVADREVEVRALVAHALLARAEADRALVEAGIVVEPVEDRDAIDLSEWDR